MFRIDDPLYDFHQWFADQQKQGDLIDWDIVFQSFQTALKTYYAHNKRLFAWREIITPYNVVVSEIMLQQTQTERVAQKFPQFIATFPDFVSLAQASKQELIQQWVGLGYNRRAFALQGIAQAVIEHYQGILPYDPAILQTFKGIGPATAASIAAFAYNQPTVFIETNVRTVFLHTFFHDLESVSDKDIFPLVEKTLDKEHARDWYYALMDYGVCLKKLYPNPSRKSRHYVKQSTFQGSDRQVRGAVLKLLAHQDEVSLQELKLHFPHKQDSLEMIMQQLINEKIIKKSLHGFTL